MPFNRFQKDKECAVSIGDIFLRQGDCINETQFIATSRYMDIKRYCDDGLSDFPLKNLFCNVFFGERHNARNSNLNFESLIKSFKSQGLLSSFPVELNNDGYLIDGNHRCGACLYFKNEILNVRVKKKGRRVSRNIDNYIKANIPTGIIESVLNEFDNIQKWLVATGNTFAIKASGFKNNDEMEDFLKKVRFLCNVLKTETTTDSIIIQFSVSEPQYKCLNNRLVSFRCLEIGKTLEKIYQKNNIVTSKSCYEGNVIFKNFNSNDL